MGTPHFQGEELQVKDSRTTRKMLFELKSKQYRRVSDHVLGAIEFHKQHVIIPAHDMCLVAEAIAKQEEEIADAQWRENVLEVLELMEN
jgi:hypothetical protein